MLSSRQFSYFLAVTRDEMGKYSNSCVTCVGVNVFFTPYEFHEEVVEDTLIFSSSSYFLIFHDSDVI